MEKMNDLRDLLLHEIQDLISAEDQMIANMPAMIETAKNPELKRALKEHLAITQRHRTRLDEINALMDQENEESKGLLARLFRRSHTCKGMEGILDEGKKMLGEDMHPDVMDAAIIAAAQKAEHYEICGYGTARAYAEELGLREVEGLLLQTLDEEYDADEILTVLAVNRVNKDAEVTGRGSNKTSKEKQPATRVRETQPVSNPRSSGSPRSESGSRGESNRTAARSEGSNGRGSSSARSSSSGSTKSASSAKKSSASKSSGRSGSSTGRGGASGRSNSRGR